MNFDANYSFYNPENTTNLKLILPFSLGIELFRPNFSVELNQIAIPFEIYSFSEENLSLSELDLDFISGFLIHNPITLVQCNFTILENQIYTIRYQFKGIMNNPLDSRDLIYIVYYLNSTKVWDPYTTGRVEFRVYGKIPVFSTRGSFDGDIQTVDFSGGKSAVWNWNLLKMNNIEMGLSYDERSYTFNGDWTLISIIIVSLASSISIITIIVIIFRKKR